MPFWNRRHTLVALAIGVMLTARAGADAQEKDAPEPPEPRSLRLGPATEPRPALRYRLMPLESERTPGDAAPIYLRLVQDQSGQAIDDLRERPTKWLDLPLEQVATNQELRDFVSGQAWAFEQLGFGSRRQTCDWNYTLAEQREHCYEIRLPDANFGRVWARMLAVKARLEIAEHRWDDAARTLETGLAFGNHVGDGPFLINRLVGMSISLLMLERIEEWLAQPGSPSLYWALSTLPRPLIDFRSALNVEEKLPEWAIPELTESDRPHTEAEWTSLLARLHARLAGFAKNYTGNESASEKMARRMIETTLEGMKADLLPRARPYLKQRRGLTDEQLRAMSDDQVIVLAIVGRYQELRDDVFRPLYLPYLEARELFSRADDALKAARESGPPLGLFVDLLPEARAVKRSEVGLAQRIAALRVIEAIRLHAGAHDGKLPKSLAEITIVPIPTDPATQRPFEYTPDGDGYLLRTAPENAPGRMNYRLVPDR